MTSGKLQIGTLSTVRRSISTANTGSRLRRRDIWRFIELSPCIKGSVAQEIVTQNWADFLLQIHKEFVRASLDAGVSHGIRQNRTKSACVVGLVCTCGQVTGSC